MNTLMRIMLGNPLFMGVCLTITLTILILLGGRRLTCFASWLHLRTVIRRGRTIHWDEVIDRCKAGPVVIVIETKSCPRKAWFLTGNDEAAFFSRKESPRTKGLLVIDLPGADRISKEVENAGGRVVEIDMNGVFW